MSAPYPPPYLGDVGEGAPTLLLVHGWGCDGDDWAALLPALAPRHRVLVPDLPGHGRTPPVPAPSGAPNPYAPRALARELAALVERLGAGPVVAVGHSMGGHVVSALAVEHPRLVRSVVTVATGWGGTAHGAPVPRRPAAERAEPEERAEPGNPRRAEDAWALRVVRAACGPGTPPEVRARHERLVAAADAGVLARCREGMYRGGDAFGLRPAARRYLSRRRCPVLAVHTSPEAAAWERRLPRHPLSRVELWEGCGHYAHEERPGELAALLEEWCAVTA